MALSSNIAPDALQKRLCAAFCGDINVNPVASGLAVSSAFKDNSGDRISFYLRETPDGLQIEDDGSYLAELIGRGVPIDQGTRANMLDAILSQAGAYWDRETYEIKSTTVAEADVAKRMIDFLSSLIRVRDLELFTREVVRSTFREDATSKIENAFGDMAELLEDKPVMSDLSEFPADLVIKPRLAGALPGAVYFVNSNDKLNEALLLLMEGERAARSDFAVFALLEDANMTTLSRRRFQRAQNRSLKMPIFRGDEDAAMNFIGRELRIPVRAH